MQSSLERFAELFCNFGNQTVDHGDYQFSIRYEEDTTPFDPRECDNNGIMVCFHNRYTLGDRDSQSELESDLETILDKYDIDYSDTEWLETADAIAKKIALLPPQSINDITLIPLYLYDHSGLTMNTTGFNCAWDSGQVGWIYTTPEQLKALGHNLDDFGSEQMQATIKTWLAQEVESYDHYLTGNIFGYSIYKEGECLESCTGFLGDHNKSGLFEQMHSAFTSLLDAEQEQQAKRNQSYLSKLKALIRNRTSLATRKVLVESLRADAFALPTRF